MHVEAQIVYGSYKAREAIEQVFDFLKIWWRIRRIWGGTMRYTLKFFGGFRERDLVEVSVREVLLELSKIRMIVKRSGREYLCALPKKTQQIAEVFSDIMTLWIKPRVTVIKLNPNNNLIVSINS